MAVIMKDRLFSKIEQKAQNGAVCMQLDIYSQNKKESQNDAYY